MRYNKTTAFLALLAAACFLGIGLLASCAAHAGDGYGVAGVSQTSRRCYVGAFGMGDWQQNSLDIAGAGTLSNLSAFDEYLGGRLGCDIVQGQFLFGAFGDYSWRVGNSSTNLLGVMQAPGMGNQWSLGVRAGFLPTPGTLVYGLVAYQGAQSTALTMPGLSMAFGDQRGIAYGGGVETKLGSLVTMDLQYRRVAFGDDTSTLATALANLTATKSTDDNQIRLGFNIPLYNTGIW